ncbi:MAG: biotin/lipoyl-binding protein [Verrucomicrobiota bacterium]
MDALPPVPVPLSVRWREFRTRLLPIGMAIVALVTVGRLWRHQAVSADFPGVAEGIRATVTSPQPGIVRQLFVHPYQEVQAGQTVAILVPSDLRTQLDLLQAELQLASLRLEPSLAEQNAVDYERLRFEWWRIKAELAGRQIELQRAENQVRRDQPLFGDKLLSEDLFDLATTTRDRLLAEVTVTSNAIVQMEERLAQLRPFGQPNEAASTPPTQALLSSLVTRHRMLLTNAGPVTLTAPITGMVTAVPRGIGEQVMEGEALIVIRSPRADRVVGYLRQPYSMQPQIGMEVSLSTREWRRRTYLGLVSQVGVQLEVITNSLAVIRAGALVDTGLPVVIALAPEAQIRPGEVVDLAIRSGAMPFYSRSRL